VQLKESGAKGVVVTGCMAQRYADELAGELPEVDAVVGFEKYSDIGPRIEEIITKSGYSMPTVEVGSTDVPFRPEWERYRITQQHAGYLRVAGDSSAPRRVVQTRVHLQSPLATCIHLQSFLVQTRISRNSRKLPLV
jgi:hypothetical protein